MFYLKTHTHTHKDANALLSATVVRESFVATRDETRVCSIWLARARLPNRRHNFCPLANGAGATFKQTRLNLGATLHSTERKSNFALASTLTTRAAQSGAPPPKLNPPEKSLRATTTTTTASNNNKQRQVLIRQQSKLSVGRACVLAVFARF